MADEEAQLLNKQAAAPAKASSSWRLAVVVALVLGLVAGYVAGAAGVNKTNPIELRSGGHPAHGSGSGEEVMYFFASGADPKYSAHGHGHKVDTEPEDGTEYTFGHHFAADQ